MGVAKTYVISKKTLENITYVATKYNASRDALVVISIERIVPLLVNEQQKHRERKQVLAHTRVWLEQGQALVEQSRERLSDDDPAVQEPSSMFDGAGKTFANFEDMVDRE